MASPDLNNLQVGHLPDFESEKTVDDEVPQDETDPLLSSFGHASCHELTGWYQSRVENRQGRVIKATADVPRSCKRG